MVTFVTKETTKERIGQRKSLKGKRGSTLSFTVRAKIALIGRRWTIQLLAHKLGRRRETVSRAINQTRSSKALEKQITEALSL